MDNRHSTQTSTAHAHERTCTAVARRFTAQNDHEYPPPAHTLTPDSTHATKRAPHSTRRTNRRCSDAVAQAYGSLGGDDKALEEVKKLFNDEIDKLVQVCRASCDDLKPELGR